MKSKRAQEIKNETKALARMTNGDLDIKVRAAACRKYQATINEAFARGRIWTPNVIRKLYPVALALLDEVQIAEAESAYEDARFQLRQTKRKLKSAAKRLVK